MTSTTAFRIAALLGFLAVALGAFGAHGGLHDLLAKNHKLEMWEKAVFYHLVHAAVLLAIAIRKPLPLAGWCLIFLGVLCFSGSLYLLAATSVPGLVWITPVGGVCLLGGWLALAFCAKE